MRIIILLIAVTCLAVVCFARPEEATPPAAADQQRVNTEPVQESPPACQGKHFIIYAHKGAGFLSLSRRLDINSEYLLLENISLAKAGPQQMFAAILDAIFQEASDVLHMYVYSFKGNIRICRNQYELNRAFRRLSGRNLRGASFYAHETNSIYINAQTIRLEDLAYDIAQAIIAHYFAVYPPERVREPLAKDVGYQIKKLLK